jgi:hypothetical protein
MTKQPTDFKSLAALIEELKKLKAAPKAKLRLVVDNTMGPSNKPCRIEAAETIANIELRRQLNAHPISNCLSDALYN